MNSYPIQAVIVREGRHSHLTIEGPRTDLEHEDWRLLHHDYLAAMRSLRYLAQKGLLNPLDTPEQSAQKKQALERHLKQLERFEAAVVLPVLYELPRSMADASS